MRKLLSTVISWMKTSNRWLHLAGGFSIGIVFGLPAGITAAATAELKDVQWNRWNWKKGWDWTDFAVTVIGASAGGAIHYGALFYIIG